MTPFSISGNQEQTFSSAVYAIATPVLNAVAYVAMVVTGTLCVLFLVKRLRATDEGLLSRKRMWFYLVYVGCMVSLGTVYTVALQYDIAQPRCTKSGYWKGNASKYNVGVFAVGNCSFAISATLADALVVWRCSVIYQESRWRRCVQILCWLLFASVSVVGLTSTVLYSIPSVNNATPVVLAQSAFVTSATLNVVCTVLIVARLYGVKKYLIDTMGSPDRCQLRYATISAALVESCALYATFSVALLVLWFLKSPGAIPIIALLGEIQIISVFMVIVRVSRGIAWTSAPDPSIIVDLDLANFCKPDDPEPGPRG